MRSKGCVLALALPCNANSFIFVLMSISTFDSFKSRNYRLFFAGQSISLIGTWMQKTAVSWVIYSVTQSKLMLGVAVFATLFPTAAFSLFGGIAADRYDRHKLLLLTQIVSSVQAVLLTLAVIYFKNDVVLPIILLSVFLGIINGFDVPARQSLVKEMVDHPSTLPNALALNSSMVNLSKFIGPAIAGFVLEKFGTTICFALNAISFIPVIISLLMMRLPAHIPKPKSERSIINEFKEAFIYIKKTPEIGTVIAMVGAMSLFVLPYSTLTPVYAKDIFHGDASTLGVIDGCIGLGAFVGAIYLASLKQGVNLPKVMAINCLVFGVGLMLFSYTTIYFLSLLFIAFTAYGMMAIVTVSNTLIQVKVESQLRGRVISIFVMVFTAALPLGSLLVGTSSHYIGVQKTVFIEGIFALVFAVIFGRNMRKQRLLREQMLSLQEQPEGVLMQA